MKNKNYKNHISWQILLALVLIVLSAVLYFIHYLLFKDTHHIFIYLIGDIAFVPFEVLLVTLIIHKILSKREKSLMLEKLNMLIGAFYSEVGAKLIACFSNYDPDIDKIKKELIVNKDWLPEKFISTRKNLKNNEYKISTNKLALEDLSRFLIDKREFMLRLLENPNLLEHESFTELLWAVFHLTEELTHRESFENLPESDHEHLAGDINRVYTPLVHQWLDYMCHLKNNYPYLFSLAMRTNPFDTEASPIIK